MRSIFNNPQQRALTKFQIQQMANPLLIRKNCIKLKVPEKIQEYASGWNLAKKYCNNCETDRPIIPYVYSEQCAVCGTFIK